MDDHTLSAAETTAVIVVNAIKTHTSLCIPGATDVRPTTPVVPPSSLAADATRQVNGARAEG
jgi:hypothetical protein